MRRAILTIVCLTLLATQAFAAKRVALVIGNDNYKNLPAVQQLKKARNDARAVARTLEGLGFKITLGLDLGRSSINQAIDKFALSIEPGDTATVFFAGHGLRIKGRNYLLPSDVPDMSRGSESYLATEAIPVDRISDTIKAKGARIAMLILDACRNNPFKDATGRSVGGTRGLARMEPAEGTFILFSAGAGQEALDRLSNNDPNPNSVFTRSLIPLLAKEGLEVGRMARLLRQKVKKLAATVNHTQTPAVYNEVTGDFYLLAARPSGDIDTAPTPVTPPVVKTDALEADYALAAAVGTAAAWKAFLVKHGSRKDSFHVQLAKAALKKLAVGVFPSEDKPTATRAYTPGDTFKDCDQCPEMVVLPAGSFIMGAPESEKRHYTDNYNEGPQHKVTIQKPFAVGKFEITLGQFKTFVKETGHKTGNICWIYNRNKRVWEELAGRSYRNPGFRQSAAQPVVCVNWDDAKAYVKWLSGKTGEEYRLLSEAEWEYAARAGTTTRFHFGNGERALCVFANGAARNSSLGPKNKSCADGSGDKTTVVGSYKGNQFGLYDMHGNVWELLEDCWNGNYNGAPSDGSARTSGDCSLRVLRGGSWSNGPAALRSASRFNSDDRDGNEGFRVARTLAP